MKSDAEFNALRAELVDYSRRINDLAKFSIITTVALLGYAAASKDNAWLIALLPLAVVAPLAVLSSNAKFQIVRIATYLRVRYAQSHPYEYHLKRFREELVKSSPRGKKLDRQHPSVELGTAGSVAVVGVVSLVVSLSVSPESWDRQRIFVTAGAAALWVLFARWLSQYLKKSKLGGYLDGEMEKLWKTILDADS